MCDRNDFTGQLPGADGDSSETTPSRTSLWSHRDEVTIFGGGQG